MKGQCERLVLASANVDKVKEISAILFGCLGDAIELVPRPASVQEVEEDGETLLENARLKAVTLVRATGIDALSDDTGLEVEALGGAPGVYSARYAGEGATYEENVKKLLATLGNSPNRAALFRCVAFVAFASGEECYAEGVVSGTIARSPRGRGGFGYDPIFVPDEGDGRSFAEMSPAEKHRYSHRGRAFRSLSQLLKARGVGISS